MTARVVRVVAVAIAMALAAPLAAAAAQTHIVQPGETLWFIAERYQISVDALVSANNLTDPDALQLGQKLIIPTSSTASDPGYHVVRPGDTLWSVASRHGISVSQLQAANRLPNPDALRLGQTLVIPSRGAPAAAPAPAPTPSRTVAVTYVVRPGDTLWSIAAHYRVSVDAIVAASGLRNPDALWLGQRLRVPVPATQAGAVPAAPKTAATLPPGRTLAQNAIPSRGAKWGSALLATAGRLVGVRYRWGGISPRGFDCSGFINYVMRAVGVSLPRTTFAMWQSGRSVPRDQLKVGDVVFFETVSPGPSHAGIYIGNNQFIQSSSGFGRVTVTSLDYRYYKSRYLGARRF